MITTPESMFNFLFYVDEMEQLYFSESSSADIFLTNYVTFSNKGNKNARGHIDDFYRYLESKSDITSIFYDASKYRFHTNSDVILLYGKKQIKMMLNANKNKYYLAILTDGNTEIFEFSIEDIGSEIFYNIQRETILYNSEEYYPKLTIPEGRFHNRNTLISEYDYKKGEVITRYLLCMMKYYWHLGVDDLGKIYFYRSPSYPYYETENNRQTDYTVFEPRFNTGEIQIYDTENQTLTILEHPFPEPVGAKPIWTFYVVQKDGTIYCQYIMPDGNYIIKITPDWSSAEPYPDYTPTFLNCEWEK